MRSDPTNGFVADLCAALEAQRRTLARLIAHVGVAQDDPQELARRLGLHRVLTWKLSKVITLEDPFEAARHMPGPEGTDIFRAAAARAGAPEDLLAEHRAANELFLRCVEQHAGDRATFDLMLDGLRAEPAPDLLAESRKLAFRGNSGLYGLRADARLSTFVIAPNADRPDTLDCVRIGGVVGLLRFRPGVRWTISRRRAYHDDGTPMPTRIEGELPLLPGASQSGGPLLLPGFCTQGGDFVEKRRDGNGFAYDLLEGPIGKTGACDCFFAGLLRAEVPRYRGPGNEFGELFLDITLPVEAAQYDLFVRKDVGIDQPPMALVRASILGASTVVGSPTLPIVERTERLPGWPRACGTTLYSRYPELVALAFDGLGADRGEFDAYRLTVAHPPINSSLVMRFPLKEPG